MKHSQNILKLAAALCVAIILLSLTFLVKPDQVQPAEVQTGQGLALQPPAFLKSAHAAGLAQVDFGFIIEEAGITAYTNLNQELDLASLESRFKTIRQQTDEFIIGIVIAPGYEKLPEFGESAETQVFLHREGWIVSYLTMWQPAAAVFDWVNYDEQRLTGTLIENVVRLLALDTGVTNFSVAYYDFRHPDATNLILAAERVYVEHTSDSFEITIPRGLTVYESSWSQAKFGRYYVAGECKLNDEQLNAVYPGPGKWALATDEIVQSKISLGATHKVTAIVGGGLFYPNDPFVTQGYCGIAVVYRETN